MPYYHTKDNGRVGFWTRKCRVCSRKWPLSSYLTISLPKGMIWKPADKLELPKGEATYAKWGDRLPGVSIVASRLPNWPRWLRILTMVVFVGIALSVLYIFLRGF